MEEYYVEQLDDKWGVFWRRHSDTEMLNADPTNPNLIVWTYEKIYADKIAEVLNVDEYIHERYVEEN